MRNIGTSVSAIAQRNAKNLGQVIGDIVSTPIDIMDAVLSGLQTGANGNGGSLLPPRLPTPLELLGIEDPVANTLDGLLGVQRIGQTEEQTQAKATGTKTLTPPASVQSLFSTAAKQPVDEKVKKEIVIY